MFELNLNDLNQMQIDAIESLNNILLIACPGSGKTRTLTYKIAYELSKLNSKKKYIIAITYTNRAADEIKERIELLGIDIKQLWIGTIHSFCLEWILRPYSLYMDELKKGFNVINSYDTEKIITDLCQIYNINNCLSGRNRLNFWDFIFHCSSVEGYEASTNSPNKQIGVTEIFNLYLERLRVNKQIDFEQILYYSYQLLVDNQVISKILSNIFKYILIDEFQDTKDLQYKILGLILTEGRNNTSLFMVGDPNQSIFGSLGGYAINKEQLEELTNLQIEEKVLINNYRSSEIIVNYFNEYKTYENQIIATGRNLSYPSIITFDETINVDELINEIVRLVNFNMNERNIQENEIAILGPWWIHLISLTRQLSSLLPNCNFDGPGLVPFSRDHDNFFYKLSRIALTKASPKLYLRRVRWAKEIIDELSNHYSFMISFNPKTFLKICNSIDTTEQNGMEYLRIFFNELFSYFNIEFTTNQYLSNHYNAFFNSTQERLNRLERENISNATDLETFRKVFKERNGITVSSIHGVKGAEFDTVIAFGLLEGILPHFNDLNGTDSSKKMLYVLSSRAKKNLHLISERGRTHSETTRVLNNYDYMYSDY